VFEDLRRAGWAGRRWRQAVVSLLLSLGLTALVAGCGFNAQTNMPYTPADGTNADLGAGGAIKIRNLVVISDTKGSGVISATLIGNVQDQLTSVSVTPLKADGSAGTAVTATPATPLQLGGGSLIVLTNVTPLKVTSPDLVAGLSATVTMNFTTAGPATLNCPVVDGTQAPWSAITPGVSPTPSPEPTPS
jgi:hypothetical protein